jgi:hypothetical protein
MAFPAQGLFDDVPVSPIDDKELRERWGEYVVSLAAHAVHHVQNTDAHPVSVTPQLPDMNEKKRRKAAKTRKNCPWLDPTAPRVIMLNPAKHYPAHGRTGERSAPTGAKVRPHQRRGHWRTLRDDRYGERKGQKIWIKPAWIGDREWAYKGNIYRVQTDLEKST